MGSGAEALAICVAPAVVSWMITYRFVQARVSRLQRLIEEQERVVDARHGSAVRPTTGRS
jgi:hypothetical protein